MDTKYTRTFQCERKIASTVEKKKNLSVFHGSEALLSCKVKTDHKGASDDTLRKDGRGDI